ncbi:hypothetical protein BC567DRAFT_232793 [Phyllosticta citribraziliensis]
MNQLTNQPPTPIRPSVLARWLTTRVRDGGRRQCTTDADCAGIPDKKKNGKGACQNNDAYLAVLPKEMRQADADSLACAWAKVLAGKCSDIAGVEGKKCSCHVRPASSISPSTHQVLTVPASLHPPLACLVARCSRVVRLTRTQAPDDDACTYLFLCKEIVGGCGPGNDQPNCYRNLELNTMCACPRRCERARAGFQHGPKPSDECSFA